LVDWDDVGWKESILKEVFLPLDVDLIKSIPLSLNWPSDRVEWHCAANGELYVKLAFYYPKAVHDGTDL